MKTFAYGNGAVASNGNGNTISTGSRLSFHPVAWRVKRVGDTLTVQFEDKNGEYVTITGFEPNNAVKFANAVISEARLPEQRA